MSISSNDGLLVCAIDFGTTFSGYAYSMKTDFEDDPLKISLPDWKAPSSIQISEKTPTTLLMDGDQNFVAFGYEAESKYAELAEEDEHLDYYYFRRFKMVLYNKLRKEVTRLTMETKIKDITEKKEILAMDIFSHSIEFLKKHMLDTARRKGLGVRESEINWVLTVPAMWSDPAKQFMSKAAEKAGIPRTRLILALEPEAASIYCRLLPLTKLEGSNDIGVFKPGSKYLVLDAGGGTVDITVHKVRNDGSLEELEKASGGDWGGTCVDMTFKQTLMDVVGELYVEEYCLKFTGDYIELLRDFEMKKRKKTNVPQSKVTMKIPATFSEWFEEHENANIIEITKNSKYGKSMKWEGDKLRITQALFDSYFQPACAGIIDHVSDILQRPKVKGTSTILMVGGFSESPILQARLRHVFPLPEYRVVVPIDAGLAVLKGAVLFGHNPRIISARIAKYAYGVASFQLFDPKIHEKEKKVNIHGKDYCSDIFHVHVKKGATLFIDDAQLKRTYEPNRDDQTEIDLEIYISELDNPPKYVTDPGCQHLGTVTVKIPDGKTSKAREVSVQLIFGGTEIRVVAKSVATGNVITAEFNLLEGRNESY
ncbi:heat shock 70 kDa protein 12B-like [Saccostrea echinata]|uniref:heat shock 70 kDa protein 12B-like n=1 Tax=Saccostrea echinata TaxID=191078 RepID=UPI002A802EFB|nr:heat shock 70 kDa protein 12B-like [Saccostrea echinata]